jgi:hypothetical protein
MFVFVCFLSGRSINSTPAAPFESLLHAIRPSVSIQVCVREKLKTHLRQLTGDQFRDGLQSEYALANFKNNAIDDK